MQRFGEQRFGKQRFGKQRFGKPIGIVIVLLMLSLFVGCSGGGDDGGESSSGEDAGAPMLGKAEDTFSDSDGLSVGYASDEGSSDGGSGGGRVAVQERPGVYLDVPAAGPHVIKTAKINLKIDRDSLRDSVQETVDIAQRHGGFVLSSQIGDGETGSGSLVVRVPSAQFESALGEFKEVGEVEHETISGEDVGQEYVDLRSRLRNFEAQEVVLLDLMEKATTVSASITVQRELQQLQLQIERLRGQLNYLDDQTSYSTVTIDLNEAGAAPPTEAKPQGKLSQAWSQAKETFLDVVSATIVGGAFVLPVALLFALVAFGYRIFVRPRLDPAP